MPIPTSTQLEDIPVPLPQQLPPGVRDSEVDRQNCRISWNAASANNPVVVAKVNRSGMPKKGTIVAVGASLGFPNMAEWGLINNPNGAGYVMGLYFNKNLGGTEVIMEIDPAQPPLSQPVPTFAAYPPLQQDPNCDYWLVDGWEGLNAPMVLYVRVKAGADYRFGRLMFCDLTGSVTGLQGERVVPNFDAYYSNTTNRAMRVVPEHPATIQIKYTWPLGIFDPFNFPDQTPSAWELRWQDLRDPAAHFTFTPLHSNSGPDVVIGVGVQKLNQLNPNVQPAGDGYFVYVLRRDQTLSDYIDFYIFDYHPNDLAASAELLRGTVPLPPLGPHEAYRWIGDDESYIDPMGNPCIALTLMDRPGNPNSDPGVVCVFKFAYMDLAGPVVQPADTSFTVVTPAGSPVSPRKDPETLTVVDPNGDFWVYIFNREYENGDWRLHRTLAWRP